MKTIISIMMITIGCLVFFVVSNETPVIESKSSINQSLESLNSSNHEDTIEEHTESESTNSGKLYAENSSTQNKNPDRNNNSKNVSANSSYYQDTSNNQGAASSYGPKDSSYNQDNQYYGNSSSSYEQENLINGNTASNEQLNNKFSNDNNSETSKKTDINPDTETAEKEITENVKYQRLYDNDIMWYGDTGTLMVEYQSSHAQTTGIGFRVHFDSSSIRPINIAHYPVDAIINTMPNTVMSDTGDYDNNSATDLYLPFAWASIYGQWPQTNELNLATIDFEKVNGGSNNYVVNYSAVSVPAGFQLVK